MEVSKTPTLPQALDTAMLALPATWGSNGNELRWSVRKQFGALLLFPLLFLPPHNDLLASLFPVARLARG